MDTEIWIFRRYHIARSLSVLIFVEQSKSKNLIPHVRSTGQIAWRVNTLDLARWGLSVTPVTRSRTIRIPYATCVITCVQRWKAAAAADSAVDPLPVRGGWWVKLTSARESKRKEGDVTSRLRRIKRDELHESAREHGGGVTHAGPRLSAGGCSLARLLAGLPVARIVRLSREHSRAGWASSCMTEFDGIWLADKRVCSSLPLSTSFSFDSEKKDVWFFRSFSIRRFRRESVTRDQLLSPLFFCNIVDASWCAGSRQDRLRD